MRRVKKSRNGCSRCKSKRVKCGEEKPDCHRCARLGLKCPGYVQSLRWVSEYESVSNARELPSGAKQPGPDTSSKQPVLGNRFHDGSGPDSQAAPQSSSPLDETNAICDSLWDFQNGDSLPELADLCAPSLSSPAASAVTPLGDSALDYGSSVDNITTDESYTVSSLVEPETQENDHSAYGGFSPSAIVRNYPPPSQKGSRDEFTSIRRPLNNPSWTLIEYYFKEVAALFSSYDSKMNPFRTTVSRLWGSSLAICRTMQSMAAATLVNDFPQFGPIGLKMRNEAINIITHESVMDDRSLLALLMLGQTASWHRPNDLGISFFNLLRKHLNAMSSVDEPTTGHTLSRSNNYQFFEEALVYWEMLLSFVADNDAVALSGQETVSGLRKEPRESVILQRVPHPWTGIARDTQSTVQEVGRLVRRERKRVRTRTFTSQADIIQAQRAIAKAQKLEEILLEFVHPSEAEIVSPGDDDTPVWHLLTMAEVYRCTGLMQLYRTFPDLLRRRLPFRKKHRADRNYDDNNINSLNSQSQRSHTVNTTGLSDSFFSFLDADMFNSSNNDNVIPGAGLNIPETPNLGSTADNSKTDAGVTQAESESEFYDNWLTEFALTTLSRLKTIPLESRTRCLQPFLLVASCSELRLRLPAPSSSPIDVGNSTGATNTTLPNPYDTTPEILNPTLGLNNNKIHLENPFSYPGYTDNTNTNIDSSINIPSHAIEVSRTRKFILGRLTSLLHVLPPKPITVCLKLVREVWDRLDRGGEENVYWVDVMVEKGWETTMG